MRCQYTACVVTFTQRHQVLLFSATVPPFVETVARKYMKPNKVTVDTVGRSLNQTSEGLAQRQYCLSISILYHLIFSFLPRDYL
jgi:superfamily II DNA/RNA helicase